MTLHHRLVAAGKAQSKLIADHHHQSQRNDCTVAYCKNIIAGKERLIDKKRFQTAASDPGNKNHDTYLNDLQVVIHKLSVAYDELHKLEFHFFEVQESQDVNLLTMKADTDGG